jgi:DNA (cytosine-5)-methyltransferase 1
MNRTFASLFTGGGGADLGAIAAGMEPVWGVEYNKKIWEVASRNLPNLHCLDVLQTLPCRFPAPDWLHASPPCTNFSPAKSNRAEAALDLAYSAQITEFICALKPDFFSLENVQQYKYAQAFKKISDCLNALGYWWKWEIVNAENFGVPQSRKRLILLATKSEGGYIQSLPAPEKRISWYEAVEEYLPDLKETGLSKKMAELSKGTPPPCLVSATETRRDSARESWQTAFTITASSPPPRVILENGQIKQLNTQAIAALQSFPKDYKWGKSAETNRRIIGNSVPPLMAEKLFQLVH